MSSELYKEFLRMPARIAARRAGLNPDTGEFKPSPNSDLPSEIQELNARVAARRGGLILPEGANPIQQLQTNVPGRQGTGLRNEFATMLQRIAQRRGSK